MLDLQKSYRAKVLVSGIAYEGISIPVLWSWLDKAGNATGNEHLEIVKRFVKLFGKNCIEGVLGDREFANKLKTPQKIKKVVIL